MKGEWLLAAGGCKAFLASDRVHSTFEKEKALLFDSYTDALDFIEEKNYKDAFTPVRYSSIKDTRRK